MHFTNPCYNLPAFRVWSTFHSLPHLIFTRVPWEHKPGSSSIFDWWASTGSERWLVQGHTSRFRSVTLHSTHELSVIPSSHESCAIFWKMENRYSQRKKTGSKGWWRMTQRGPSPLGSLWPVPSVSLSPEHPFLGLWSLRSSSWFRATLKSKFL